MGAVIPPEENHPTAFRAEYAFRAKDSTSREVWWRLEMTLTVSGLLLLSSSESRKQSLMMPFLELQSTWNRVRKAPDLAGGYSYSDAPELEHAAVRTCGVQEPEEQEKHLVLFATESKHLLPRRGDSRRDTTTTTPHPVLTSFRFLYRRSLFFSRNPGEKHRRRFNSFLKATH